MQRTLLTLAIVAAFAGSLVARHGADDPAGDDRGNHGPGHKVEVAKHGADDPAGDDRGNHGPGHKIELA